MKKRNKRIILFIFLVLSLFAKKYSSKSISEAKPKKTEFSRREQVVKLEKKNNLNQTKKTEKETQPPLKTISFFKKKIQKHLSVMHIIGENSEKNYQESLDELKKNKETVSDILYREYRNAKESNYLKRQQLIETIRALKAKSSIPMLTEVALEKLPEEKSKDLHHGSTQLEEGIIRLTAIEGLGYFAKNNNPETLDTLMEIIKDKESPLPLKRQAVREYLLSNPVPSALESNKATIKEFLNPEIHFIVTEKIDTPEELLPDNEEKKLDHHNHESHDHAPIVRES